MPGDRGQSGRPGARASGAPQIAPGSVVADKYVVEDVLGSGAMGVVVSARHKLIGQRVAIKFIKSSHVEDADALARFKREARALVAVQSENVVRVFDYGTLPDESPYLVMELLSGRDLLKELRQRGSLPLSEAAEIVLQACEGLAAVHARGIVHRDIKPANLFLTTRANGKLAVKIVDFGISKAPKMSDEELSLTQSSIGSPHYMSPEQLRSARTVDARSDVWSLGVVLHRALTGELPFAGDSVGSLMAAVLSDEPRRLRDLRPDLPAEMETVIGRCLAKKAEDRFASVQELADALTPFAMPSDRTHASEPPGPEPSPTPPAGSGAAMLHESTAKAHVAQVPRLAPATEWSPRAALATAIGAPLAMALVTFALLQGDSRHAGRAIDAGGVVASSAATAITDLPLPKTSIPPAAAAYQAAVQAVRDASFVLAYNNFDRAASLDPTMAAAQLRSALYGDWLVGADTRRHARTALALRESLTERDRALLAAFEPLYLPPHPDMGETQRRVDALVLARPGDAEILFLSGLQFLSHRPRAEVLRATDRVMELDPKFAGGLWLRALTEQLMGDHAASLRTVERCLAVSPSAASCLRVRATLEDLHGDCAGLEADSERMVAMEGDSYRAYDFLAAALLARGRPIDGVREVLGRKWHASAEGTRAQVQRLDEAHLAFARGDFPAALRETLALQAIVEQTGTEHERAQATMLLLEIDAEMGETALAARVADAYLRRIGAWSSRNTIDDDPRPRLYAAALRGGLRTPLERDEAREEWLALWNDQVQPLDRARIWIEGYAAPAETREEAEQALGALSEYAPLPRVLIGAWTAPALSKVYWLAGRGPEALPELQRVASSCRLLAEPGEVTRATMRLGQALEQTGDAPSACAAYAKVIDRWGGAKTSVTATAARARVKALGCVR